MFGGDPGAAPRGSPGKMDFNGWQQQDHSFPGTAWKLGSPDSLLAVPGGGCGVMLMLFLRAGIESQAQLRDIKGFLLQY